LPVTTAGQIAFHAALVARVLNVAAVVLAVDDFLASGTYATQVAATNKIAELPNGTLKSAQNARVFRTEVTAVNNYEATGSAADLTAANAALTGVTGTFGTNLGLRVTAVSTAVTAVGAFETAGTVLSQSSAQTYVDALPAVGSKTLLQNRINAKVSAIVTTYETTDAWADTDAQAAVTALPSGATKTAYQARIQAVRDALAAYSTAAGTTPSTPARVNAKAAALAAANALPAGARKTALLVLVNALSN
jgi:hypothetical protein